MDHTGRSLEAEKNIHMYGEAPDSEETINRAIEKHFGHLPQEIVETFRIDGLPMPSWTASGRNVRTC